MKHVFSNIAEKIENCGVAGLKGKAVVMVPYGESLYVFAKRQGVSARYFQEQIWYSAFPTVVPVVILV